MTVRARPQLAGEVVAAGDPKYDEIRAVWNRAIDRRPWLVCICATVGDIVESVRFARRRGVPITVRGGGHSVAGWAVCDGGVVIDLRLMRNIEVDPAAATATVAGGCTWAEFDTAAAHHNLATTGGVVSTTGVAGLTLGGGIGWLTRRAGPACYNLLGATVVGPDGTVIQVGQHEQPELLWALRGGGGLGVVASLEFRLHRIGSTVTAGARLYPLAATSDVLAFLHQATSEPPPPELGLAASIQTAPEPMASRVGVAGQRIVALGGCWSGNPKDSRDAWRYLPDLGPPLLDTIGPMSYVTWQRFSDAYSPPGLHNYWKAGYLTRLDDTVSRALAIAGATAPSPRTHLDIHLLGAGHDILPPGGAAYDHRGAKAIYNLLTAWERPEDTDANVAHTRASFGAIVGPGIQDTYLNYLSADDGNRVNDAFGTATLRRLVDVRKAFDPDEVFAHPLTRRWN